MELGGNTEETNISSEIMTKWDDTAAINSIYSRIQRAMA